MIATSLIGCAVNVAGDAAGAPRIVRAITASSCGTRLTIWSTDDGGTLKSHDSSQISFAGSDLRSLQSVLYRGLAGVETAIDNMTNVLRRDT